MKRLSRSLLLVLCLALSLIACSDSKTPQEGQQYVTLPSLLDDNTLSPVTEVFSLTCSHCRNMEKFLPQISQQAGADIGKMHITFNHSALKAAVIYYAAEIQLGRQPEHELMDELFAAIQSGDGTAQAQKDDAIKKVFSSHNLLSPEQFSTQQSEQLKSTLDNVQNLSTQSAINAVPTFIVRGRYQVLVSGHDNPQQIANTISYLLKK